MSYRYFLKTYQLRLIAMLLVVAGSLQLTIAQDKPAAAATSADDPLMSQLHADSNFIGSQKKEKIADNEIEWVISIIEQIRSVRSELRVPAGSKVPLIQIKLDDQFCEVIKRNKILIERLARLSSISKTDQQLDGIVTVTVDGGEFALNIADLIDIPAERSRLLKTISKNNNEVNMLKNKLSNEKFLKNAPQTVINEAKGRLEDLNQDLIKLSSAMTRLQGGDSS